MRTTSGLEPDAILYGVVCVFEDTLTDGLV